MAILWNRYDEPERVKDLFRELRPTIKLLGQEAAAIRAFRDNNTLGGLAESFMEIIKGSDPNLYNKVVSPEVEEIFSRIDISEQVKTHFSGEQDNNYSAKKGSI